MKHKYELALMDMACRFGQTSTATRLKVGCMIYKNDSIIALGVNGQPPKWHTEVCEDEDNKTLPTVRHAEAAALEKLYLSTETSEGGEMFVSHAPCLPCALKIVAAKIKKVYYREEYRSLDGLEHLRRSGVDVIKLADYGVNTEEWIWK
jgi:dCMP deaminase